MGRQTALVKRGTIKILQFCQPILEEEEISTHKLEHAIKRRKPGRRPHRQSQVTLRQRPTNTFNGKKKHKARARPGRCLISSLEDRRLTPHQPPSNAATSVHSFEHFQGRLQRLHEISVSKGVRQGPTNPAGYFVANAYVHRRGTNNEKGRFAAISSLWHRCMYVNMWRHCRRKVNGISTKRNEH